MGKAGKSIGRALGFGGRSSAGPQLNMGQFNLDKEAAEYQRVLNQQRDKNLAASAQLTDQLQQQAQGKGPLAGAQLRRAQNRNLSQTLAAAQSMGGSPLAQRNLLQARGQSSRDLAELGQMEQLQSQQALGQQLGQESSMAQNYAQTGFGIARGAKDLGAQMEQTRFAADVARRNRVKQQQDAILGGLIQGGATVGAAMSDERKKKLMDATGLDATAAKAQLDEQDAQDNKKKSFAQTLAGLSAPTNAGEGIANAAKIFASTMGQKPAAQPAMFAPQPAMALPMTEMQAPKGLGQMLVQDVSSDENKKKVAAKANKQVNDMMDTLQPYAYEYKNPEEPGAAPGPRVGIMAQDLEKSSIGKTLVKNTPNGKMVDTVQGFGAVLAAQAELNRRLKKLEGKKGQKA